MKHEAVAPFEVIQSRVFDVVYRVAPLLVPAPTRPW